MHSSILGMSSPSNNGAVILALSEEVVMRRLIPSNIGLSSVHDHVLVDADLHHPWELHARGVLLLYLCECVLWVNIASYQDTKLDQECCEANYVDQQTLLISGLLDNPAEKNSSCHFSYRPVL